jgi:hypothetical protein
MHNYKKQEKMNIAPENMTPKQLARMLSEVEIYPLFSSLNKARAEDKNYEQWLESIPANVVGIYSNHQFIEDKRDKGAEIIDQDFLGTILLLNALCNDNKGLDAQEISDNVRAFQMVLCALWLNKEIKEKFGVPIKAVFIENATWETALMVTIRRNEEIQWDVKKIRS